MGVVGNLTAKMNHIPPGLPGYPQYSGIPEHKLRNKHFNILTMDLHVMDNDKIRRQWHFADHQLALKQMLSGEQNPSLTHEYIPRGQDLRESRKWLEISVMSSPISKWKEKPLSSMRTLSLFFPKCLEPSKILARSMMAKKKMKFHSCLVFLLRNSSERGLKLCTWVFTALEMARSNKIITLKIGPQLFTKCSTTDLHLTLDLRETLLISKCSIFIS